MKLHLNLGCGKDFQPSTPEIEWKNLDADYAVEANRHDANLLWLDQYYGGQADHIEARDILEHIPYSDNNQCLWKTALRSWVACLKPGGTINVQVPCPMAIFKRFCNDLDMSEYDLNRVIYGESTNAWDRHYQLFSLERLRGAMADAGLEILEARELNVCAIVLARKP